MQGTYTNNSTEQQNTSRLPLTSLVDASTLYTRQLPNHLSDNQFPQPYLSQNGGRAMRLAFGVRF